MPVTAALPSMMELSRSGRMPPASHSVRRQPAVQVMRIIRALMPK
jgi:hypothetical protein